MYADEDRNETTKCTEWQYIYGDIGPTIVSEVIPASLSEYACVKRCSILIIFLHRNIKTLVNNEKKIKEILINCYFKLLIGLVLLC